jgi:hypothetical protein
MVASIRAPRTTMPLSSSLVAGLRAVGLRGDEGVGAEQVLLADLLVVPGDVVRERGIGLGEPVAG